MPTTTASTVRRKHHRDEHEPVVIRNLHGRTSPYRSCWSRLWLGISLILPLPSFSVAADGICLFRLQEADGNGDGLLGPTEFAHLAASFVSNRSDLNWDGLELEEMPYPLQETYQELSDNGLIHMDGLGKTEPLTPLEVDALAPICETTRATVETLLSVDDSSSSELWSTTHPPTPAPQVKATIRMAPVRPFHMEVRQAASPAPTISARSCIVFIVMSDGDSDGHLNETEFVSFLNRMTAAEYDGAKSLADLPETFGDLYSELVVSSSSTTSFINIAGSGYGTSPTSDEARNLDHICTRTTAAIQANEGGDDGEVPTALPTVTATPPPTTTTATGTPTAGSAPTTPTSQPSTGTTLPPTTSPSAGATPPSPTTTPTAGSPSPTAPEPTSGPTGAPPPPSASPTATPTASTPAPVAGRSPDPTSSPTIAPTGGSGAPRPSSAPIPLLEPLALPTCREYLTTADENANDVMLRGEYIDFTNLIADKGQLLVDNPTFSKPFAALPQSLQDNYLALETSEGSGLNIAGSKPNVELTQEQTTELLRICTTTEAVVLAEMGVSLPPLDGGSSGSPTAAPSTAASNGNPTATTPTTVFSSVAPSFAPSMAPSSSNNNGTASLSPTVLSGGNGTTTSPSSDIADGPTQSPTSAYGINGQFNLSSTFYISNPGGYTAASLRSGKIRNQLVESFRRLVRQSVKEMDATGVTLRRRRQLRVVVQQNSVHIVNITDVDCSSIEGGIPDAYLCQEVEGRYTINATNEVDSIDVVGDYTAVVDAAIKDGLLQQELDSINKYSPLTIETGQSNVDRTPPPPPPEGETPPVIQEEDSDWLTGVIIGGAIIFMMVCTYFFLKWFDRYSAQKEGEPSTKKEFSKKRPKVKKEQKPEQGNRFGRRNSRQIT